MAIVPPPSTPATLVGRQAENNRSTERSPAHFASHRQQVMALVRRFGRPGGRLCVLGAGNANDLDLQALTRRFREVHLIDLDAGALSRAVARQEVAELPRVAIHAPVDLTGLLDHLPEHGPFEPGQIDMLVDQIESSPAWLGAGRFDLVVSAGLLTQIYSTVIEFDLDPASLARLIVAFRAQHLRQMSRLATPGGACLLVTELVSSTTVPTLSAMRQEELRRLVPALLASRNFFTGTHPAAIVNALSEVPAGLCRPAWVEPIAPWLWQLGDRRAYLAFAVAWGVRRSTAPAGACHSTRGTEPRTAGSTIIVPSWTSRPSVEDEMICAHCGAALATRPHRCQVDLHPPADAVEGLAERSPVGTPAVEEREIYVDLADLDLPWQIQTFDDRATIVSYIYERFVPYADDGWVWVTLPSDPAYADWVYGERDGRVTLAGANLRSRRVDVERAQGPRRAGHPVSLHRLRQLAQRPWTSEPASKAWRRIG